MSNVRKLLLLPLLLLLVSCNATTPTPPGASTPEASNSAGSGVITGVLVDEQNQPIQNIGVFLADLTPGPEDSGNIISFQLHSSKRGMTDEQGRFTIQDVAAGSYSLAVWTPNQTQLVPEPNGAEGSAILVEVPAGKTVDVGTVKVRRPR